MWLYTHTHTHTGSFIKKKNEKGITLIALIITIIVLIILAGISIMMISGNDGILARAGNAKNTIGQASAEEKVKRAIMSLQIDGKGSNNGIKPAKIAEQVNKDNGRTDVTAEGENFPTNIVFGDGTKVYVNLDLTVGSADDVVEPGLYPVNDITENQIAPPDLFTYKPLTTGENNTQVASTNGLSNLPKKTIKITGINEKYCYNYDVNGAYGLTYKTDNFILTNKLIIPYQVEYEGEMYTVTEVDLTTKVYVTFSDGYKEVCPVYFPNIGNIIYPNTVTKILAKSEGEFPVDGDNFNAIMEHSYSILENIILSSSLTEIPDGIFNNISAKSIVIPKSVTKIGRWAIVGDDSDGIKLTINYMGTEEQWNKIEKEDDSIQNIKEIIYNYDINSFGKEKRTYTTEEKEMLKKLNDVLVKKENYFYKLQSGLYTSKDKELKDLIGYKDFQEYYEARIRESVEDYYNRNYNEMSSYSRYLSIIKTIPTDKNGKWDRLTEIFIKSIIPPPGKNLENLQDVWKAWKEQGKADYTKYNTLEEYFNGEKENISYYFETLGYDDFARFVDSCIRDYQQNEF